jgi:hypothetical protein
MAMLWRLVAGKTLRPMRPIQSPLGPDRLDRSQHHPQAGQRGIRRHELHGYRPTQDVAARWAEVMAAGGSIHAPKRAKAKPKSRNYSAKGERGISGFSNT